LSDAFVYRIKTDSLGSIWIETRLGLNRFDPTMTGGRWYSSINRDACRSCPTYGAPDKNISTYYADQKNKRQLVPYAKYPIPEFLVLSWDITQPPFNGVDYTIPGIKNTTIYTWTHFLAGDAGSPVLSTAVHPKGKVWFGLQNGIVIYDTVGNQWQIPAYDQSIPQIQINTITHTPGNTWLGKDGYGLL
jgi:ligand-binding sensor domain-containing protein